MIVEGIDALPYVIVADDAFLLKTGSLEALSILASFCFGKEFWTIAHADVEELSKAVLAILPNGFRVFHSPIQLSP